MDIQHVTASIRMPNGAVPMPTRDPFLFCVHHVDNYPKGNAEFGPATSLNGHNLGQDFEGKDGFRMYHGHEVPGFPRHPHRGFETVTIVRRGLLDHADSLGAAARYGEGDLQWLTAGKGIQHSEMFPLLHNDRPNPVELFQIWLNLPGQDKMVDPHFSMLWANEIPTVRIEDVNRKTTELTLFAGSYGPHSPPPPPPSSWAHRADSHVALWSIRLPAHGHFTLPPVPAGVERSLYVLDGAGLTIGASMQLPRHRHDLVLQHPVPLQSGTEPTEMLLMQGRPIGEPVAHHGPFVMNTRAELQQAVNDYQATGFGAWPWNKNAPVHGPEPKRFARSPAGSLKGPPSP